MSLPAHIYADLVGKPFEDGGRGPDTFDCWGVLQAIQRRLGNTPTDFPSRPELLQQVVADEWQPIQRDQILPGDAILLRSSMAKYTWHIGVVVDSFTMLHARESVGVCAERIDSPAYTRRIVGFYRFRGRA